MSTIFRTLCGVLESALEMVERDEIPVHTFALYHDHESSAVSVCVDTLENSRVCVGFENDSQRREFLSAIADKDLSYASLCQANVGRNLSLGDFAYVNLARTSIKKVLPDDAFYLEMVNALECYESRIRQSCPKPLDAVLACSLADSEVGLVWPLASGVPETPELEPVVMPPTDACWFRVQTLSIRGALHLAPDNASTTSMYEHELLSGQPVEPVPDRIQMETVSGRKSLGWMRSIRGLPVVHATVAAVLRAMAGNDVQLIPVSVDGKPSPYSVVVVCRLLDCLDLSASNARTIEEVYGDARGLPATTITELDELVLDSRRVPPDVNFFRVARLPAYIVVSRTLACALVDAAVTGIELIAVK